MTMLLVTLLIGVVGVKAGAVLTTYHIVHLGRQNLCIRVHGQRVVALLTSSATTKKHQGCGGSSYIKCHNIYTAKGVMSLVTVSATTYKP